MKKILLLLLVTLFLSACEKDTIDIPRQHAGRTMLAFFWADNNLSNNLSNNILSMVKGMQEMTDSATLLVYWDGERSDKNYPQPVIMRYTTDGRGSINNNSKAAIRDLTSAELIAVGEVGKIYPDQVSTDKQVMQTVISDMMACYPSNSYGIVFGSHGSGWLPTITGTRSIGQDGAYANTAVIPELAEVLRTVNPQKFDFVLFDACMMGCAEVYYELKDATKYCIASVLDIPAKGFPYESLMADLYADNLKDHLSFICKTYIDAFNNNAWGTIAAVDCSQMEGLAVATRNVILANQNNLKNINTSNLQEYGRERPLNKNFVGIAYDMLQYIKTLNGGEAPTEFMEQFDKTVLYADYTPSVAVSYYKIDGDNYCGMGMYIPNSSTSSKYLLWNNYFKSSIAWYQAAGWGDTETIWGK